MSWFSLRPEALSAGVLRRTFLVMSGIAWPSWRIGGVTVSWWVWLLVALGLVLLVVVMSARDVNRYLRIRRM
jgi:hypothetical protein